MLCDRCGGPAPAYTTSYFDTSTICVPCSEIEEAHPKYEEANQTEIEAVQRGDFNFPGIGVPSDLQESCRKARAERERLSSRKGREA